MKNKHIKHTTKTLVKYYDDNDEMRCDVASISIH